MDKFISGIKSHYEMTLKSGSGLPFYDDINHYLSCVIKTSELYAVITEEYTKLKNELKGIEENPFLSFSVKEDMVDQAKKLSLYTDYLALYKAIYLPFQANDSESILGEESSKALFYLGGIEKIPEREHLFWKDSFALNLKINQKHFTDLHFKLLTILEAKNKQSVKNKPVVDFHFDPNTGEFRYNKIEDILSPKSREFKFLKILYLASNHQATYEELCNKEEKATSNDKNILTETVKILKRKLGILSKTAKHKNKNIIKNLSKYGYKLEI